MAFNQDGLGRWNPSMNDIEKADLSAYFADTIWTYASLDDAAGTITASGYFNAMATLMQTGQLIKITADNLEVGLYTIINTAGVITVTGFATIGAGGVGAANLGAVTGAGLAGGNGAVITVLGDGVTIDTNGAANSVEVIGSSIGSAQLSVLVEKTLTGTITALAFEGMYATPISLLAALGTHKAIKVKSFDLELIYGTTQYAAGGAIALQYGNAAHGAGLAASASLAAATVNGAAAGIIESLAGVMAGASSAIVNEGIFLSNATQAFTTGDSTFNWSLKYYELVTSA